MTFRITSGTAEPEMAGVEVANLAPPADKWNERIVKLIPAEALGLYGTGSAIVPDTEKYGMYFLTVACIAVTVLFRYKATQSAMGKPQIIAIAISVISFLLWLLAFSNSIGPFELKECQQYWGALLALTWGVFVPALYKGDQG